MDQSATYPFRVLCIPERQALYAPLLASVPYRTEMYDDSDELLRKCLIEPPCAIIADFLSITRLGHAKTALLFDLSVRWPVVRCGVSPDGKAMAMCYEPARREPLLEAMAAIAADDPTWQNPRFQRRNLRIDWHCRVKIHGSAETWYPGNTLNLSAGGMFVVTYETLQTNQDLALTVMDLDPQDIHLQCKVAQVKNWASDAGLPGLGLRHVDGEIERFRQALVRPELVAQFRRSIH